MNHWKLLKVELIASSRQPRYSGEIILVTDWCETDIWSYHHLRVLSTRPTLLTNLTARLTQPVEHFSHSALTPIKTLLTMWRVNNIFQKNISTSDSDELELRETNLNRVFLIIYSWGRQEAVMDWILLLLNTRLQDTGLWILHNFCSHEWYLAAALVWILFCFSPVNK